MDKKTLRITTLEKRKNIRPEDRNRLITELLPQLLFFDWNKVDIVMSYFPMKKFAEPEVAIIEKFISTQNQNIRFCYPRINGKEMDAILIDDESELQQNKFNTSEIINGNIINPKEINLILIPLLVADKKGFRVGFGKGFYDRFLQNCNEETIKLGVGFFPLIDAIYDVHPNDIRLDFYSSPQGFISFQMQ